MPQFEVRVRCLEWWVEGNKAYCIYEYLDGFIPYEGYSNWMIKESDYVDTKN